MDKQDYQPMSEECETIHCMNPWDIDCVTAQICAQIAYHGEMINRLCEQLKSLYI